MFTSSSGDGDNVHAICESARHAERQVSPTRFHNSVHNAAAGYWSIATQCRAASTSLCCHDASFAAGLLEAASQVAVDGKPVALIAYDHPYPAPLRRRAPDRARASARRWCWRRRRAPRAIACLDVEFEPRQARGATRMPDPGARSAADRRAGGALPAVARGARPRHRAKRSILEYVAADASAHRGDAMRLTGAQIAGLIPHSGAMCLLDGVVRVGRRRASAA